MDVQGTSTKGHVSRREMKRRKKRQRIWIASYLFIGAIFLCAYLLMKLDVFEPFGKYRIFVQKIALGGFFAVIILACAKWLEMAIVHHEENKNDRYNLIRLLRLLSVVLIIVICISFLYKNWYAAALSVGVISLILGFALQTPISSFIGWLYILIRRPFRVGDRIQLENYKGDVVEINYLDTTLWEFGGNYLTNDLPTGRLIRFPNSLVFAGAVFNYSWHKFPYIWNEIPFHIAYESDLEYVVKTIREVAKAEMGEEMAENIKKYKSLVEQTPVDELDVKDYPFVSFRTNSNTWLEALLTYLVEPKQATNVRTNLVKKITEALLKHPDRVMFPKSNAR